MPDRSGEKLWTPANVVTLVRICLVPVFVVALLTPWPQWFGFSDFSQSTKSLIAAGVFIVISCTDWIDGYLARSRGEVTDFGKFMDPLADKILVAAALLSLVELSVLPSWPVLVILVREFIVSGVRMIAASKGEVIAASWYGKAKTVLQIVAIVLFLIKDSVDVPTFDSVLHNPLYIVSWIVMIAALVMTIVSMLDYLSKARHLIGFARPGKQVDPSSSLGESDVLGEGEAPDAGELRDRIASRAQAVVEQAVALDVTLGTAESLTGGLISGALTSVPGSSAVVLGGIASYAFSVKEGVLGVDADELARDGAVTEACAREMAEGARSALECELAVSVTGIAGPGGEEPGKPVGTVWMALCDGGDTTACVRRFSGDREAVRLQTVYEALGMFEDALRARTAER